MAETDFADRLRALDLGRIPEADHADLERLVQHNEAAAARLRQAFSTLEEPSNVFRLARAPGVPA